MLACVAPGACLPATAAGSTGSLVATSAPALSGTPAVGQALSCSSGSWSGEADEFGYTWLRDGHPIAGQTASSYVIQEADRGHSLACEVSAAAGAGSYTISRLPSGTFDVRFQAGSFNELGAGNYITTFYQQAFAQPQATVVQVSSGAVTSGIDAQMPVGGQITGRVSDASTHSGLAAVEVCAGTGFTTAGCAETNAAGEYDLVGLASGSYTLFANIRPTESGFGLSEDYDGGSPVSVNAGSVTSGVDIEVASGQIAGVVTSATGTDPLAGVKVCAWLSTSFQGNCARSNAQGEYTIALLGPGAYKVEFSSLDTEGGSYIGQYYPAVQTRSAAAEVTVEAGRTRSGIDAELPKGGGISGIVRSTLSTHLPLEHVSVCAILLGNSEPSACASTNAAGEYAIEALSTGSYAVRFKTAWESVSSTYPGSYYDGKATLKEATPVSVTAGSTTGGVDAELQAAAEIAGEVTSAATGSGLAEVSVCALGDSGAATGMPVDCTQTDASGDYVLAGVEGSSAIVQFEDPLGGGNYLGQLYSDEVGYGSANPVQVTPGETTEGIDAQLHAGGEITGRVTSTGGVGLAGVEVCAEDEDGGQEAVRYQTDRETGECTFSSEATASGTATSDQLAIPLAAPPAEGKLKLLKERYDAHTGKLDFTFAMPSPGRLTWTLSFKNAVAGFVVMGRSKPTGAAAATAARGGRRAKRCGRGKVMHDRRCVPVLVALASGSRTLSAGTVEVQVRPDAVARRALAAGQVLLISGSFKLRSGTGALETQAVAMKVKAPRCKVPRSSRSHGLGSARCLRR